MRTTCHISDTRRIENLSRSALWSIFSVALLLSLFAIEAAACSCGGGGAAPCQEYWRTDVIFAGTVVGGERVTDSEGAQKYEQRLVRFVVAESFRGLRSAEVEVVTGWGGGDCGYEFVKGETYLVYAFRGEKDKLLRTGICTRTRPLAEAAEDLTYMRGISEAEQSAFIFGRVVKRNYEWEEGEELFLPVGSAELTIEGRSARAVSRTDAQGRYRVAGLAPGPYKVRLKLPKGLTDGSQAEVSSVDADASIVARGCAEVDFHLEADTRIGGRVVDAAGQPAGYVPIEIRGAPGDARNVNTFRNGHTDEHSGRFEFKNVPPGNYLLVIRQLNLPDTGEVPYPRTYYPGVGSRAQAGIITVGEGEHLRDIELRLPPRLAERSVEGLVVRADGRPVPEASFNLSLIEEGETMWVKPLKADDLGRFTLKIYDGLTYRLSAHERRGSGRGILQSEWVELPQAPDAAPVRLVLPAAPK